MSDFWWASERMLKWFCHRLLTPLQFSPTNYIQRHQFGRNHSRIRSLCWWPTLVRRGGKTRRPGLSSEDSPELRTPLLFFRKASFSPKKFRKSYIARSMFHVNELCSMPTEKKETGVPPFPPVLRCHSVLKTRYTGCKTSFSLELLGLGTS